MPVRNGHLVLRRSARVGFRACASERCVRFLCSCSVIVGLSSRFALIQTCRAFRRNFQMLDNTVTVDVRSRPCLSFSVCAAEGLGSCGAGGVVLRVTEETQLLSPPPTPHSTTAGTTLPTRLIPFTALTIKCKTQTARYSSLSFPGISQEE